VVQSVPSVSVPTPLRGACEPGGAAPGRLPRVERLRRDLLDAPYELCTRKAELLTEFFREYAPGDALRDAVAKLHFAAARRALERSLGEGAPRSALALRLSQRLQRFYQSREERPGAEPPVLQYARALAFQLERVPLRIYAHELIVGNPSSRRIGAPIHPDLGGLLMLPELATLGSRPVNPIAVSDEQRRLLEEEIFPFWFTRGILARAPLLAADPELSNTLMRGRRFVLTQFAGISHVTPDYPAVLAKGFEGLLADVAAARGRARTPAQAVFAEAAAIAAGAAIAFGERWRGHCAQAAAAESDPERASELRRLAEVFAQVPARPARSFHEALQSVLLCHVIVHQESFQHGVSFGRVDQYLLPYYRRDVEAGRLGRDDAIELIACFLGKAAELLPLFNGMATEYFSGLSSASGLTLGGCDADGRDAANELSFLFLEAYDQLRLRQPNLHLRVHPQSDPALLTRAHEVVKRGGGMPAFFNDRTVIPALEAQGIDPADARDYSIVGCVEWGVPRKSFPAAGAGFLNLPAALEDALRGGDAAGDRAPPRFASMHELVAALRREIARLVAEAVAGNDAIERAHALYRPTPLLSLLVQDCVASGVEVNAGGARYDSTGLQGVGVADVADSLAALEAWVFEAGRVDQEELRRALADDFAGAEALRRSLQSRVPKYGEDRGRAEHWARVVVDAYCGEVARHRNPRGGRYVPGFWSMTTHVGFGRRVGALPSGRHAGEPLADGLSPANGCDAGGPTASLLAAARAQAPAVGNGLCLNERIAPWIVQGDGGTRLLASLTRGYFDAGGMQVQYNILDPAVLRDAQQHPERYRDLVVRISGYSAYWNDLTPEMQADIIARTQHGAGGTPPEPEVST
jgi:pyruvate formate-lyase/glycerol dehydratase family glycyl radical enzyme